MNNPEQYIGTNIGQYQLVEYLGAGGMAQVFKGYHADLQRYAAIKILHPQFLNEEDFVTQFKNEAKNLALLRHPNIVQVYDASISSKFPYIVMEYVAGKSLQDFLHDYQERQIHIPLSYSLRIIYSIALALGFAHQNQITHRDVKPGNVLLEDSGRVVLTDFGLAQLDSTLHKGDKNTVIGTPAYLAPEQALGKEVDARADQYSLGVIFFEMLTGRKPYDSDDPVMVALSHVTHEIPSPKEYVPEIPDEVAEIALRATRKDPNERFASIEEFTNQLSKVRLKTKTTKLPTASLEDLRVSSNRSATWAAPEGRMAKMDNLVCLHFIDTGQVIDLELNHEYLIGRKHKSQPIIPDIDLSPFNAYEWGISRLHASMTVRMNDVSITDIGSANGTWHAGKRLPANQAYPLHHGDVLHLGKLKMQVLIYM